jgi:hypothetical protein
MFKLAIVAPTLLAVSDAGQRLHRRAKRHHAFGAVLA